MSDGGYSSMALNIFNCLMVEMAQRMLFYLVQKLQMSEVDVQMFSCLVNNLQMSDGRSN